MILEAKDNPRAEALDPTNPFHAPSTLPYQAPPFDKIEDAHYLPAIEAGMAEQRAEIDRIANNPAPATFENTLVAMEQSGRLLTRVLTVFGAVTGANTNPTLQDIKTQVAPRLAAHADAINLNEASSSASPPSTTSANPSTSTPNPIRLIEIYYDGFIHSGSNLNETDKTRLKQLNEEASTLSPHSSPRSSPQQKNPSSSLRT